MGAMALALAAAVCAAAAIVELAGSGARAAPRGGGPGRADGRRASGAGGVDHPGPRLAALLDALVRLGRRLGAPAPPRDLAARLAAAGSPLGLRAGDVMAVKCGGALVAALVVLPLASGLPGRLGPLVVTCAPAAGFLAPDLWLRRRARSRAAQLARELPDVLDLLRVAIEAGLPAGRALAEVGRRRAGLLARELRTTAREMALGASRAQALESLAARCPIEGVVTLVAALQRAERHGTPLAEPLATLAGQARAQRARALLEAAARAAPKIQLAVALLLVPAVMLLVAAALVDPLAR